MTASVVAIEAKSAVMEAKEYTRECTAGAAGEAVRAAASEAMGVQSPPR
jgi:hypothetical protein